MLEQGLVDAVVCIGSANTGNALDWATPEPILARTVEDVRRGRGVKPSLAPTLRILDEIKTANIKSLLVCGVGCAVQAFRAVESTVRNDNPLLQDILFWEPTAPTIVQRRKRPKILFNAALSVRRMMTTPRRNLLFVATNSWPTLNSRQDGGRLREKALLLFATLARRTFHCTFLSRLL